VLYAAFAATAMQFESARSAARFVDSIGVNVHLSYWDTPYGKRFPEVAALLERSGIRHVRDGVVLGQQRVCDEARELAAHGIRFTFVTQPARTAADLRVWAACVGPAIEAYEAPNEYDISHPAGDAHWADTLRTFQKSLYAWVKETPALAKLPVIGPSLTSKAAFATVGDLSAYLDFGNMHDYFAGHEPGTPGWASGGYGSIAYNIDAAQAVSKAKPIAATETGYATGNAPGDVPEAVEAAYVPRMFLDQFLAGVVRTDEYELVDEGGAPFGTNGLLDGELRPKPAFTALAGMIALLSDDAPPASLARVPLEIGGDTDAVRHALFEKHDGRCYLAVWQEAPSVEPKTQLPLPVATRNVTVTLGAGWQAKHVLAYSDDEALVASAVARVGGALPVAVRDRVVFVEIAHS
jgi:hypothetical protein